STTPCSPQRGRASGGVPLSDRPPRRPRPRPPAAAVAAAAADWRRPRAARVRAIRDRLRLVYGIPAAGPHGDPIAELVLTVLSQSTNDRNRDVAYLALVERFSRWEAVRDAPVEALEEAIRPGGISKVKSARIKSILAAIAPAGPLSLEFLRDLDVP